MMYTTIECVIFMQKNIRNKLRSFFSEVKVEAVERVSSMGGGGFPELDPIQDIDGQTSDLVEVKIRPNCKRDPCQPDLSVNFLSGYSVVCVCVCARARVRACATMCARA